MKKLSLIFVFFLLSFQLLADNDEKLKLAVMDLEDLSGKLSEETLAGASEYIRVAFASTNRYIIISKERQKDTVSDMRKKFNTDPRYKSCTDKNCQIQLGQALSADLIVKTSISFFADSYTLSSELIDLEKEATIFAAREEYDGSQKAMKTAMDNIIVKIVEAEKKENKAIVAQEKFEKEKESKEKAELEERNFNSRADEKLAGIFSGRWNLGLGLAFSRPNIVGFSTGLDFDFKVFEKPYGGGAGILFVGLGFDLRYWITTGRGVHHGESYKEYDDTTRNNLINFPIQFNFGYEFKLGSQTLRYFGLWFSPGFSLDMDIYDNGYGPNEFYFTASFSWKITMNMIFKNGMLFNLGFGGNKSKEHPIRQGYDYWHLDHIFLMIGTGVIF